MSEMLSPESAYLAGGIAERLRGRGIPKDVALLAIEYMIDIASESDRISPGKLRNGIRREEDPDRCLAMDVFADFYRPRIWPEMLDAVTEAHRLVGEWE